MPCLLYTSDTCYKPIHKEIAMSDLKNDLKNVPYIKQFFGEYLDLRKDKDLSLIHI